MKYAVEMDLSAMVHIPSFIKIDSGSQKLIGVDSQIHRQHGNHISLLYFFVQNKESRLEMYLIMLAVAGVESYHL
jgi:hypothetical protein